MYGDPKLMELAQNAALANARKTLEKDPSNRQALELVQRHEQKQAKDKYGENSVEALRVQKELEAQRHQQQLELAAKNGLNPDGSPIRPEWEGILGEDGNIKDQYQLQYEDVAYDNRAMDKYAETALRDAGTESEWAKQMLAKQAQEQSFGIDDVTKDSAGAEANAIANMMMYGGADASAMARVARDTSRNSMLDRQGVKREGQLDRMNIGLQDEQSRMDQLGTMQQLASQKFNADSANRSALMDTNKFNIGNSLAEVGQKRDWDMGLYKEQMGERAAKLNSESMKKANSGGGGGCCFILLEASYPNGVLPEVVRRYRDENMTEKNKRGYYKLAEVLVPLMRSSKLIKALVKKTMADPLVAYGNYHYGKGKLGILAKPIAKGWLKLFDFLGGEHPFIRENGEEI